MIYKRYREFASVIHFLKTTSALVVLSDPRTAIAPDGVWQKPSLLAVRKSLDFQARADYISLWQKELRLLKKYAMKVR